MNDSLAPTRRVRVVRLTASGARAGEDVAAAEEPLDIRLHDRSFAIVMRTPGHDRELAAGFLLAERIIRCADDLGAVEHCRHPDQQQAHHVVNVFLRGNAAERIWDVMEARRQFVANSACGVCGRSTIDELRSGIDPLRVSWSVDPSVIAALPAALRSKQAAFDETGGLHAAALFRRDGTLEAVAEDVGRHNAVDKIIGARLLGSGPPLPLGEHLLMVSGRVSFEIVQKAWLAGVPLVAAISAPTSLAVDLAREANVTLVGFVRDGGFNVYTHEVRVAGT
jgi:FdhD protein